MTSESGDHDEWPEDEEFDVESGESPTDPVGFFPDMLRKGLSMGFTGFFMTEEAIRRALGDSVPKDVMEFVIQQSDKTRAELLDRLSKEFGRALHALDPVELARRMLDGRTIEVSAKVRFVADDKSSADDDDSQESSSE